MLLGIAASAEPLPVPGDPAWHPVTFPSIEQHTRWAVEHQDGRPAWRARADCSASGVALAIDPPVPLSGPDAPRTIRLGWRWKVEQGLPRTVDERTREGDDFAARVSAVFAFDPARASWAERAKRAVASTLYGMEPPGRSLGFVWARARGRQEAWESPYGMGVQLVALRGPGDGATWHAEEVELIAAHRRHLPAPPTRLMGIALMTDADNGCSRSEALYTDFRLEIEPRSEAQSDPSP